jgi:hypothetical protein
VEITSSEYSNLATRVTNTGKYGVNDAGMVLIGNDASWGGLGYAISPLVGATNLGTGVVATTIPEIDVINIDIETNSITIISNF